MYPVFSILRRSAAHVVYVGPDHLREDQGRYYVELETQSGFLDLESCVWAHASSRVPMNELRVDARSPISAAISLSEMENRIAATAKVMDAVYTLVMGPEDEEQVGEEWVRKSRYAVVRGVYRASPKRLIPVKATGLRKARYANPRTNVVKL